VINSPLPLIAGPLIASALCFLLRKSVTLSALVAAMVPAGLAVFALIYKLNAPLTLLGRELLLTNGDRLALVFIFLSASATFLGIWRTSPKWNYYPLALVTLAAVAAALGARSINAPTLTGRPFDPFQYTVLFMTIAVAISIFPLQGGQPGVASGTLRYMTLLVIALPAFLAAAWTLDLYSQSPDAVNLAQASIVLLLLGAGLSLGVVPFHSWLPAISSEAPPLSSAFVLGIVNVGVWFMLLDMLGEIKVLGSDPTTFTALRVIGIGTAVFGGGLALAQRDFGRLMGYAVLADIGVALTAVGTHTDAGLTAALLVVIVRTFGLGLMSMGLALARGKFSDDKFETLTGLAWQMPWAAIALIVGGFSLAGVPPLAGFVGRWAALQQVAGSDLAISIALLASTIGVAAGTLQGLQVVLKPIGVKIDQAAPESKITIALIVGALGLSLLIGLFPDLIAPLIRQLVAAYTG
jgi:formate hydrogenlyase subunit 3/multisubunit Na+/H+ antiporter MnhD subunit